METNLSLTPFFLFSSIFFLVGLFCSTIFSFGPYQIMHILVICSSDKNVTYFLYFFSIFFRPLALAACAHITNRKKICENESVEKWQVEIESWASLNYIQFGWANAWYVHFGFRCISELRIVNVSGLTNDRDD